MLWEQHSDVCAGYIANDGRKALFMKSCLNSSPGEHIDVPAPSEGIESGFTSHMPQDHEVSIDPDSV
jgi:hypothetical protein